VDFRNTIIIMTSNLGTDKIIGDHGPIGFRTPQETKAQRERTRKEVEAELRRTFRPEFLNRVDDIIIFQALTKEDVLKIVDLEVKKVAERISERGVAIQLTPTAREWLANEGYDPQFGARPLKRAIQRHLENPLSKEIIAGRVQPGDTVIVDLGDGELAFRKAGVAAPVTD
jgi:ATP-dependent Clp protease ATP-binding subunit ClpC